MTSMASSWRWPWGGLRPIPSRTLLDCLTLASLFYCAATPSTDVSNHALLALACSITIATAGPTSRWTISFPLVPFLLLQCLRRVIACLDDANEGGGGDGWFWSGVAIGVLSVLLLALSTALTVLFPALELSPVRGKYNVGVIDLHLPVDFSGGRRRGSLLGTEQLMENNFDEKNNPSSSSDSGCVTARLLYPTDEEGPGHVPYLDPLSATVVCAELMKAGAPGPLKTFDWMLHNWRFTTLGAKRNARPAAASSLLSGARDGRFPLAMFSHGLSGNSAIYSYQALNVAANGTVVCMIDYTDRSAIAVRRRDSSHLLYDSSLFASEEAAEEKDRKRRRQTEHRVEECLAALEALRELNRQDIPDLDSLGVSFIDRLDVSDTTMMGHSFGGCTALAAAIRRPDLVSKVVAHEPAMVWLPDDASKTFFPTEKEEGVEEEEKKNDFEEEDDGENSRRKSIHDVNMLFLYSEEWAEKGWGRSRQVRGMHERHELGPKNGTSDVGVIRKAHHSEFSDTCMLTPLWLARATGLTGSRNPHDTADEIACRTVEFLEASKKKECLGT